MIRIRTVSAAALQGITPGLLHPGLLVKDKAFGGIGAIIAVIENETRHPTSSSILVLWAKDPFDTDIDVEVQTIKARSRTLNVNWTFEI